MFSLLKTQINNIVHFTEKEFNEVQNAFVVREIPKKHLLVTEGEVAKEIYFINKGILRLFYTKEGEEITGFIFKEGLFASSYESFLTGTKSIQSLQSLESCELLVLDKSKLETLYEKVPKFHILTRKVAEQRFINAQRILSSFILDTPEERYRKFLGHSSDILLRVPQHYIASFLGITSVSLSRIRSRINN